MGSPSAGAWKSHKSSPRHRSAAGTVSPNFLNVTPPIVSVLTGVILFCGCAPARPVDVAAVATPQPTPCAEPAQVGDLSGSWMSGTTGEPPPVREVVLHTECAHHPAAWVIEQRGSEIQAWQFPASMDQGIVRNEPVQRIQPDLGRVCGREIVFADGSRLRWDPDTEHLRGTRAGKPFWAVRQRVIGPGPCPGVP